MEGQSIQEEFANDLFFLDSFKYIHMDNFFFVTPLPGSLKCLWRRHKNLVECQNGRTPEVCRVGWVSRIIIKEINQEISILLKPSCKLHVVIVNY
jgi:hypothetical protein